MNHYPRHIGDWMVATAHLTEVQECMYSRLIDVYYSREAPLPLDVSACCRLVRASSAVARKAVAVVLPEFFTQEADGWHQKRCDEELAAYHERSESAKRSVNARWAKANNERNTNVIRTYPERNTNQNHEPVTSNQGVKQKPRASARSRSTPLPPDFAVSDRVREWAASKGIDRLDGRLESFVSKCRAKGYTYIDWDDAFMGAIRGGWAEPDTVNGSALSKAGQQTAEAARRWMESEEAKDATRGP